MRLRWWLTGLACFIVLVIAGATTWLHIHSSVVADPFNAKTLAAANFPLYYPTELPKGYKIDRSSVNTPQTGVVVLTLKGTKGQKIYMSQESRPSRFDFGAYYKNFADLDQTVGSDGTIAVGHIDSGHTTIGSLATNKTWILVNTTADIPLSQITAVLSSLTVSH